MQRTHLEISQTLWQSLALDNHRGGTVTPERRASPIYTAAALLLPTLATMGCGFIFSHAPPEGYERMEYFSCTESNAGPIIDIIWGGLNVLGALAVAADPDAYADPGVTIAVGLGWGVLSGTAAGVGFNKSRKCRLAKQQLARRQLEGRVAAPQPEAPAGETVQAVVVTPQADTLSVGERLQLTATAHSSSGATVPNRAFTWSSSNDAIAAVSAAGLVTAHAAGSVVIAARTGSVVGTASITVVARR